MGSDIELRRLWKECVNCGFYVEFVPHLEHNATTLFCGIKKQEKKKAHLPIPKYRQMNLFLFDNMNFY